MRILYTIRYSVNSILETYISRWKKYAGFTMLFSIISSISALLLGLLILYIYLKTIGLITGERFRSDFTRYLFTDSISLTYVISFITIVNLGLYALFMASNQRKDHPDITIKSFFDSISVSLWIDYFLVIIVGLICIKFISFNVNPYSYRGTGSLSNLLYVVTSNTFETWFYRLILFILDYVPYMSVFFLLRKHLKKQELLPSNQNAWMAFWTVLILSFVVSTVGYEFTSVVNSVLVRFISIPFLESYIPAILGVLLYIFLMAFFYPALSGSLLFPLLYAAEKTPESSENTED